MIDKKEIEEKLRKWARVGGQLLISDEGEVSVTGSVETRKLSSRIPVTFQRVGGHFKAFGSQLTSLANSPKIIGKDFRVNANKLTTLEGMPQKIGGSVEIQSNQITSLVGCPQKVQEHLYCNYNQLENFIGGPFEVLGELVASNNPLTSLQGFPEKVDKVYLTYTQELPLLRALSAKRIFLHPHPNTWLESKITVIQVERILNKYAGEGKRGAIRCQKELIAAGFEGNARW